MAGIGKTTSNASVPLETGRIPATLGDGSHRSTSTVSPGARNELWAGLPERSKRPAEPNTPDKLSKRIRSAQSEKTFPFHFPTELRYEVIEHLEPKDMLNLISAYDDWELPVATSPKVKEIVKDIVEHLQSGLDRPLFIVDKTRVENFRNFCALMQKDEIINIVNLSMIYDGATRIVPIVVRRFPHMAAEIARDISRLEAGCPIAATPKQPKARPRTILILGILGAIGAGAKDEAYIPLAKLLNSENRVADEICVEFSNEYVRPNLPLAARDEVDAFLATRATVDEPPSDSSSDSSDSEDN